MENDPILLTEKYTVERHLETFGYIAEKVSPIIYRCIFSFVDIYKKVQENMPEIIPLTDEDKKRLFEGIGNISQKYKLYTQTLQQMKVIKNIIFIMQVVQLGKY